MYTYLFFRHVVYLKGIESTFNKSYVILKEKLASPNSINISIILFLYNQQISVDKEFFLWMIFVRKLCLYVCVLSFPFLDQNRYNNVLKNFFDIPTTV